MGAGVYERDGSGDSTTLEDVRDCTTIALFC
jgi:hypothetical protein